MKRFAILTLTALLFSALGFAQEESLPAFPGAEGYGRYVTGGRGGAVYHVTNLLDYIDDTKYGPIEEPIEGSFRWACKKSGARTIVFDVSGTIMLKGELKLKNGNVTIAGQTAPGDGVCIANYPFQISADNVIIRFMRFRLGNEALKTNKNAHEGDGLGGMDRKNIMVDHCSVSWSIDECISVYGSKNITVQWCIASHSLVNAGHSKGSHGYGGNWGGSGASYHHNFITNCGSRTPRLGPRPSTQSDERMDLRNNVMYNYAGEGCYGGEAMKVNIVNNYYKPGKASKTGLAGKRMAKPGIRTFSYCIKDGEKKTIASNYNKVKGTSLTTCSVIVKSDGNGYIKFNGDANQYLIDVENKCITVDGQKVAIATQAWWPTLHQWGRYYLDGNVNSLYEDVTADNWTIGLWNQIDKGSAVDYHNATEEELRGTTPLEFVYTTTHSAEDAYERVLENVGASLCRDEYDALLVDECRKGEAFFTGAKVSGAKSQCAPGQINTQDEVVYADGSTGWPKLKELDDKSAFVDTDGDGIPDVWERENGLNPDNAEDGKEIAASGYTNLEEYMNSLVAHIMDGGNRGGTLLTGTQVYGESSGIDDIVVNPSERPSDGKIYNLMGVEVREPLAPGVYIRDGKKFIAR